MDWKWIGTTVLAAYGAILSTYREVMARREKRVDLRVILSFDLLVFAGDGTPGVPYLQIRVQNHGGTDLTFKTSSVSLNVDGYRPHLWIVDPTSDVKFPHVLTPGSSFYLLKELAPFIKGFREMNLGSLMKVRAIMQDAIVREFYSKWVKIDLKNHPE